MRRMGESAVRVQWSLWRHSTALGSIGWHAHGEQELRLRLSRALRESHPRLPGRVSIPRAHRNGNTGVADSLSAESEAGPGTGEHGAGSGRLHAGGGTARPHRPGLLRPRVVAYPHRADRAAAVLPATAEVRLAQPAAGAHSTRPRPSARLRRPVRQSRGGGADPRGRARHRGAGGGAGLPGDRAHHARLRRDPLPGGQGQETPCPPAGCN